MNTNLNEKYRDEVKTFVSVCSRLAKNMYVTAYGGNMAWKLEEDVILITPTKMNKGDITVDDVVFLNSKGDILDHATLLPGNRNGSWSCSYCSLC